MNNDQLSRKDFLKKMSLFGALSVGAGSVLQACGGGGEKQSGSGQEQTSTETESSTAAAEPCTDLSGLSDQEKQTREQFQYVQETTKADQHCANCALFQAPEGDAPCGSCTLVKGPINPNGWCTAWAPKQQG